MKTNALRYSVIATSIALFGVAAACSSEELGADERPRAVTQALGGSSTITPTSGTAGSTVLLTGSGFTPSEAITVKFDGVTVDNTQVADANGDFTSPFEVPNGKANGTYAVATSGSLGGSASSNFTVDSTATPHWSLARSAASFDGVPRVVKHSPSSADATGNRLYIATEKGPFMTDGANTPASMTFSNITGAIDNPDGISLMVSGNNKSGVFFSSQSAPDAGHLYRSQDAGSDWTAVSANPDLDVLGWKIYPTGQTHFIGGTNGSSAVVEKAANAFTTFPNNPPPTLGSGCTVLAIDGSALNNTFAASYGAGSSSCGVYRSTDGNGATWSARNGSGSTISATDQKSIRVVAMDPSSSTTLYAGSDDGSSNVLYKSTDNGATWSAFNTGLSSRKIYAIAVTSTGVPYVGTDNGIYKYVSGSSSFVKGDLDTAGARVTSISISPTDDQKILVGVNATKSLWYTVNGG